MSKSLAQDRAQRKAFTRYVKVLKRLIRGDVVSTQEYLAAQQAAFDTLSEVERRVFDASQGSGDNE